MSKHTNGKIVQIVKEQLDKLEEQFKTNPTLFFTENDLVCTFYSLLDKALGELAKQKDSDENLQSLIHCEYPTPFRCDMKNRKFKEKTNSEEGYKKYKRGHFDIVILSPSFINEKFEGSADSFRILKGQKLKEYENHVINKLPKNYEHIVLMGIEFVYKRDPITTPDAVDKFIQEVRQDSKKLDAACKFKSNRFMAEARMIAFVKGTEEPKATKLRKVEKDKYHKTSVKVVIADASRR